jgi:hypothetical protein
MLRIGALCGAAVRNRVGDLHDLLVAEFAHDPLPTGKVVSVPTS